MGFAFLQALRGLFSFKFLRGKNGNNNKATKNLLEEAQKQKEVLRKNEDFQESFKRVEKSQKEILESNPQLVKDLRLLQERMGQDNGYDQALLADILQRTRELGQKDPRIRLFYKQQQERLEQNPALVKQMSEMSQTIMRSQAVQIS